MVFTQNPLIYENRDALDKLNMKNVLDIFVNGMLKKTQSFDNEPILNDGDFWINLFGGFDGFIAKIKYLNKRISLEEIQKLANDCPNDSTCGVDAVCPPYLDNNWWFT